MKDGVIKNNGTSRKIYANFPETYEEFRALAENANLTADLIFNANGWDVLPTFLNKYNLLKELTEQRIGVGPNASVDDALGGLVQKVGDILLSKRSNVGDRYLLCNGDQVPTNSAEYAELVKLLPKDRATPVSVTPPNGANFVVVDTVLKGEVYYVLVRNTSAKAFKVYKTTDLKTWSVTKTGTYSFDLDPSNSLVVGGGYVCVFSEASHENDYEFKIQYLKEENFTTASWSAASAGNSPSCNPVYGSGHFVKFPYYSKSPSGPWNLFSINSAVPGWTSSSATTATADELGKFYSIVSSQNASESALITTDDFSSAEVKKIKFNGNEASTGDILGIYNGKLLLKTTNYIYYADLSSVQDGSDISTYMTNPGLRNIAPISYLESENSYACPNRESGVCVFSLDGTKRTIGSMNAGSQGDLYSSGDVFLAVCTNTSPVTIEKFESEFKANLPKISVSGVYAYIRAKE